MLVFLTVILGASVLCSCEQTTLEEAEMPVVENETETFSAEDNSMNHESEQVVSAQVILTSASGKTFDGETNLTAENIAEYVPAPETVVTTQAAFEALGFEVGEMVGISFSIIAPIETFEETFGTSLVYDEEAGIQSAYDDGSLGYELPLESLPDPLAENVVAVTFTPPPDFGPFGP